MTDLITTDLARLPNAVTDAPPAMALGITAFKGQKSTDAVYLRGSGAASGPISGTSTDHAPALAGQNVFAETILYLAWKVAGKNTVEVRQYVLGQDGFPVDTGKWAALPVKSGASNPSADTDAAPAMAVGANNRLYIVWKTPGTDSAMAWSVYDGASWSAPATIPAARTSNGPALAGFDSSGPGNVWPLCLAYKGATEDGVFWAMFTPGASTLTQYTVPGASTDVTPAVARGPSVSGATGPAYVLAWKPKGGSTLGFVTVQGSTASAAYTLPQVSTDHGPAIEDDWNSTSGFGATVFDNLTVAYVDSNGAVWKGVWPVIPNPAPFPGAGTDFGRTPEQGSNNYIIYGSTSCEELKDVVVTIDVTTDLDCPKGFSFQVNANSPTRAANFSRCTWQQVGFQLDPAGQLSCWVNNWINANTGDDSIDTIGNANNNLFKYPKSAITAGSKLTVALKYASDGTTVTATHFTVAPPNGAEPQSHTIDFANSLLHPPAHGLTADSYLAPIAILQLVIVGIDNKANADFTGGAGTITVSAAEALTAGASRLSCADGTATLEQSNILYGALPATPATGLSQTFWVK